MKTKIRNPYDGMNQDDLDEAVLDMKSGEAAIINNQGRDVQIGYLTSLPFGHDPVVLTRSDWTEIYYALEWKRDGSAAVKGDKRWTKQLNHILSVIGPDGDQAAERGVEYNA